MPTPITATRRIPPPRHGIECTFIIPSPFLLAHQALPGFNGRHMLSEEALIALFGLIACGALILGAIELRWPSRPRRPPGGRRARRRTGRRGSERAPVAPYVKRSPVSEPTPASVAAHPNVPAVVAATPTAPAPERVASG